MLKWEYSVTVQCVQCTVQVLGWAGHTWSLEPGPALLRPRYGHCGATLAGQVVVVGGRGEEGVVDTVEVGTGGRGYNGQDVGVGIQSTGYRRVHGTWCCAGAGPGDQDRKDGAGLDHAQQEVAIITISTSYLHTINTVSV